MLGMLGQKIGMTRLIDENGHVIPVTLIETGENVVTRIKTLEKDGYNALVLGFKKLKKPSKLKQFKFLREFKVDSVEDFKPEQEITLDTFEEGATVTVQGISQGKGFQGVIKRHNFHRGPMSHGSDHHREPGSVGCCKPSRVKKGTKLPGRMGNQKVTLRKIKVVKVDPENKIIALKGPVPGSIKSLIKISKE